MSAFFDARPYPAPARHAQGRHARLATYQYGRYAMLTRALPKLLRDAQAADAGSAGRRAGAAPCGAGVPDRLLVLRSWGM